MIASLLLALSPQVQWTFETERIDWMPSGNVSWHGLAITDNGYEHHVGYRGNNVWYWINYPDGSRFQNPACLTCDLPQRTDEPEIHARGNVVAIAASDRSQTFQAADMTVLGWVFDGSGQVLMPRQSVTDDTESSWLGRPRVQEDGTAEFYFVRRYNEDGASSAWKNGWLYRDRIHHAPSGARQTYTAGDGGKAIYEEYDDYGRAYVDGRRVSLLPCREPRLYRHPSAGRSAALWGSSGSVGLRVLRRNGRGVGPVFDPFGGLGATRDPHAGFDDFSTVVTGERASQGRRQQVWRVLLRNGQWDGPARPCGVGDDPLTTSQNDRGSHPFALDGDTIKFALTRWNGAQRYAATATWRKQP